MEDADEPSLVSWKMIQCVQMHQQSFSVLCSIRTGPDDYNSLPGNAAPDSCGNVITAHGLPIVAENDMVVGFSVSPRLGPRLRHSNTAMRRFLLLIVLLAAVFPGTVLAASGNAEGDVSVESESTLILTRELDGRVLPASLSDEQKSRRVWVLAGYSLAIVIASVIGGFLPERIRLTHTRLQMLMSFVGGLMLGVALFHLLLHALIDSPRGDIPGILTSMGLGILLMFLLLRAFHFHQHDVAPPTGDKTNVGALPASPVQQSHCHDHDHDRGHELTHAKDSTAEGHSHSVDLAHAHGQKPFSWIGIAFGLGLHSVMDGVALAASMLRDNSSENLASAWGVATFVAVLLHKPLDAVSITMVMSASGWSRSWCTLINLSFALMCPLGAMLAWWGILGMHSHIDVVSHLLAFSAGIFLCISLSDLLPEMQFHAHNQFQLTISLLAGLGLAWLLMYFNPVHAL